MQITDTVRVVRTSGLLRSILFATVLSVQQPQAEELGTNGEPTITIGFIDSEGVKHLGGPAWHNAYKRVTGVRHVSHIEAQEGKAEYCYTEVLPTDGGSIHLQRLNMDAEDGPAAEAEEAISTVGTIVYINHSNGVEVFHQDDDLFAVNYGGELHKFSDLFSAKTFVDAKPKELRPGEEAINAMLTETVGGALAGGAAQAVRRISGSPREVVDMMERNGEDSERVARGRYIDHMAQQEASATSVTVISAEPSAADLDAVADEQKAKDATGGAQRAPDTTEAINAQNDAPTRTVEIGEYPAEENITEPFSVKIDGVEVERFLTREAAQEYIDKLGNGAPEDLSAEQQQKQDEGTAQQ